MTRVGIWKRRLHICEGLSIKGILQFRRKVKFSPWCIGPFEILIRVGTVACRIAFSSNLSSIHNVFYTSMLRKYEPSPTHVLIMSQSIMRGFDLRRTTNSNFGPKGGSALKEDNPSNYSVIVVPTMTRLSEHFFLMHIQKI